MDNPFEQLSIDRLRERTSAKWRAYPEDVLPLWVAEMDVLPAPAVVARLQRALETGDTGYSFGNGYARALQSFAADRWGWEDFPVAAARSVPDVMMGVVEVLRLVTEPGDPVVVNCPVYPPFYAFPASAGRTVVEAALSPEGRLDIPVLERTFADLTRNHPRVAYLLSNPHNPTGAVHTRAELEAVARSAQQYGVRVIVDEIHAPLVLPGATFVPYLSVPGSETAFSVISASKAFNLAGLKAAIAVAGEQARTDLERMPEEVGHGASHLGVMAHTAALEEGRDWLDAVVTALADNRDIVTALVAERLPGLGCQPPEGTYLAWIDCRPLGLHAEDDQGAGAVTYMAGPAKFFLDNARVALSSGHVFGTGGNGFVRLNFATSRTVLSAAIDRMAGAIAGLG